MYLNYLVRLKCMLDFFLKECMLVDVNSLNESEISWDISLYICEYLYLLRKESIMREWEELFSTIGFKWMTKIKTYF